MVLSCQKCKYVNYNKNLVKCCSSSIKHIIAVALKGIGLSPSRAMGSLGIVGWDSRMGHMPLHPLDQLQGFSERALLFVRPQVVSQVCQRLI